MIDSNIEPEIVFNLWYVYRDDGLIYSLRARCYVQAGNEEQKLNFLQSLAQKDYLIAHPFSIPTRYHTTVINIPSNKAQAVLPVKSLDMYGGPVVTANLFEEAFLCFEKQLPERSNLTVSQDPLICVTGLLCDADGNLKPKIDGQFRFE